MGGGSIQQDPPLHRVRVGGHARTAGVGCIRSPTLRPDAMHGTSLEIRLLGPLDVVRATHSLELPPSRTARALLAYLVATGRPHAREHLCDLLWQGPADPRGALRGALSKLRPLVDDPSTHRLVTHADRIAFEPGGALVDLTRVQ